MLKTKTFDVAMLYFLVIAWMTVACTSSSSYPPLPEKGKASLSGVLYTLSGNGPIPGTVFYLMLVDEANAGLPLIIIGPREEAGDIQGVSDEKGRFFVNNIPPGNYYLLVWAPYNWIAVVDPDTSLPLLITLEPDQQEDLGTVYLNWP